MNIQDKIDTLTRELETVSANEKKTWAILKAKEEKLEPIKSMWHEAYLQKETLTRQIEALKGLL